MSLFLPDEKGMKRVKREGRRDQTREGRGNPSRERRRRRERVEAEEIEKQLQMKGHLRTNDSISSYSFHVR